MTDDDKLVQEPSLEEGDAELSRDDFFRRMILDLSSTLQDVVGERDARGFLAIVGARMGDRLNSFYRSLLGKPRLNPEEVSNTLVDLKSKIGGGFYEIESTPKRIVLGNDRCPFGKEVDGRPALCMMTSNVFGRIAAENLGYAKISIEEAIARGDHGCRVIVHLDPEDSPNSEGVEYFGLQQQ